MLRDLGAVYTTGQSELVYSVRKALEMAKVNAKEVERLKERLVEFEVKEFINEAQAKSHVVVREYSTNDISYLKRLAGTAVQRVEITVLLANINDIASIVFATSQTGVDLRTVFSEVQSLFSGKGGGRPDFV